MKEARNIEISNSKEKFRQVGIQICIVPTETSALAGGNLHEGTI